MFDMHLPANHSASWKNGEFGVGNKLPKVKPTKEKKPVSEVYFLYGTLKHNNRNHSLLLADRMELICHDSSVSGYRLAEIGPGVPGAVPLSSCGISGELWLMQPDNIKLMQIIEQGYSKMSVEVFDGWGFRNAFIWAWLGPVKPSQLLATSNWDSRLERQSLQRGLIQ